MRERIAIFVCCVLFLFLITPLLARASDDGPPLGGSIEARIDETLVQFPLLKTDITGDVQGDLATVTVVQTFSNPSARALNATYLFPLNHAAAVYDMLMETGNERVRAVIQETRAAEATFAKAKSEGKIAALLREHRPNMFTQQLANLMPGLPIKVTLRYVQTVPKIDGRYELVIPLVVGPRFMPTSITGELSQLPHYPPVHGLHLPKNPPIEAERVSIQIQLDCGMPIREVKSDTHAISAVARSAKLWTLGLAQGRAIDNRDFVLHYTLAGEKTQAGVLAQLDQRGGFLSLLIEPPTAPVESDIAAREMVFLLDTSGSMHGLPLEASKAFMREVLRKLRPGDVFRIIRFGDSATEYSDAPLPATKDNIQRAITYTDALEGMGGTMAESGIRQALNAPAKSSHQRNVVFLTDGYIGNDYELIGLLHQLLGDARLYAFGVGAGVNRFFLDEVGRAGRGFTRYMDPTENIERIAQELTERLQSPVFTQLSIDWGDLKATEIYPEQLPDLFAGQSLRVHARFAKSGDYMIRVNGRTQGRAATLMLPVHIPAKTAGGDAVPLVWARSAITDAMYQMSLPPALFRNVPGEPPAYETLKTRVTDLGLKFSLVTKWTSFVAVSEKIYNTNPEDARDTEAPLPMVKGVSSRAYAQNTFTGAAGPEASTLAGLFLMLALFGMSALRRAYLVIPAQA